MRTDLSAGGLESLVEVLAKSRETLRILRIKTSNAPTKIALPVLSLKHLNLVEFKILDRHHVDHVHLIQTDLAEVGGDQTCRLRILWCSLPEGSRNLSPHLFASLVSLRLEDYLKPSDWIKLLEAPSKTLKDLGGWIRLHDGGFLPPIDLPNLEVLKIGHNYPFMRSFPSWMRVGPSFSTLVCYDELYSSFPSVSTLCVTNLWSINLLVKNCPGLVDLRVKVYQGMMAEEQNNLILMLQQRKRNVEAGMEIEGVKMIHLKRLVFNFSSFESSQIQQMESLVEEVLDLSSAPPIEVEI